MLDGYKVLKTKVEKVVRAEGLEPSRCRHHWILSPAPMPNSATPA